MLILFCCGLSQSSSAVSEEPEDFYEFTPEDYYRLLGTKKEGKIHLYRLSDEKWLQVFAKVKFLADL